MFYWLVSWQRALQNRYRIEEQVLIDARRAAAIATETGDVVEIAWRACQLGMWLTMRCELGEAQKQLEGSLAVAERSGNILLQAACLAWLAEGALRRHDTRAVRSLAPRALAACELAGRAGSVGLGLAKGCLVWLAWQDRELARLIVLAVEARERWGTVAIPAHSCKWVYLWPLVATHLGDGEIAEAVAAGLQMLERSQQHLPDEVESVLKSAGAACASGQPDVAAGELARALDLARHLHFF